MVQKKKSDEQDVLVVRDEIPFHYLSFRFSASFF